MASKNAKDPVGIEDDHDTFQVYESLNTLARVATDLRDQDISIPHSDSIADLQLDPSSPQFNHYRWAQAALQSLNREHISLQQQCVVFSDLSVSGSSAALQYQETVFSSFTLPYRKAVDYMPGRQSTSRRRILNDFDGLLQSGELLLVLGRPGSGCTTFLKTICGHLGGLRLEPKSSVNYEGVSSEQMAKHYRGEVAYNQEIDEHFPHLTVGETLAFAASARAPNQRPNGLTRSKYVEIMVNVVMAVFGLSHTVNTKVGDNFVHGISGGERKRVSIAEMFLSRACIGAWDNSTRGLDAASALQFVNALRLSADIGHACHAVAAYQASQFMYDVFDKVVILYEGHEIFYGPCVRAVEYFEEMGWFRDPQQVPSDFLTAITSPRERRPRPGMQEKVPRTADEFSQHWRKSEDHRKLMTEIENYRKQYPLDSQKRDEFQDNHASRQAEHARPKSPYLLSVTMQTKLCLTRAYQRMRNDLPTTMTTVVVQVVLSLIIGSMFFDSPNTSDAFFQKGAVLFFAILMNALITINEIMQLYSQRPIVRKQARYAFVHPFTEALASVLIDLPMKLARCTVFCIVLYFMVNLRREPAQFFVFYLFIITGVLTMSGLFRTLGALTKTVGLAMGLAGIMVLCILVYTGFTLPQTYMHPWFSWIRWINPIYYAFEALVSNEFHGRQFQCAAFVPPYGIGNSTICSSVGAIPGQQSISGDRFISQNYNYVYNHIWRNYCILFAFMLFFHVTYLAATEFCQTWHSQGETLVFRPGHAPRYLQTNDIEGQSTTVDPQTTFGDRLEHLPEHKDIVMWRSLNYDIPTKDGTRRLLDDVSGWVKPGTLTALMGVSGAGKTTLLDVIAQRVSLGVVSGDIMVNGHPLVSSFPRRTGYVQQQDLHLETTTVREALHFSAMLRQSRSVPKKEKHAYVEEVIQMLGMEDFAEAVVGTPGKGLNVEQRKLLSIGVELAAKPDLLIFLDEPTSGLDSQSSWTICALLRKLSDNGQAVLATIHQPSALLFQTFDRLMFLDKGGKTVYFGDIGQQSQTLLDYFSRCSARPYQSGENPAEYILEIVSGDKANDIDWVAQWRNSPELQEVLVELGRLQGSTRSSKDEVSSLNQPSGDFAAPLHTQFYYVCVRVFQQYYRQPDYIFSKFITGIASGFFIGFSFYQTDNSQQGFQNALFSIFLLCSIFSTIVNQIMPKFVVQRALYEVRERPSRVYSWKVFILSQILVEIPWQMLLGIFVWACSYFPVFGTSGSSESKALVLLFIVQFYIYAASMAQMVIAAIEDAGLAAMLATLMFGLSFLFNGIMQPPDALPRFWIFMYRVSPFTYYVGGISTAALHGREIHCANRELSVMDPPSGQTCGQHLAKFLETAPGRLYNPEAISSCEYCPLSSGDQYLAVRDIYYDARWRNYGIFWSYFVFNTVATILLYYLFRVRGWRPRKS